MKDYKIKEHLLSMKQSIDALKEKFDVLIEILQEREEVEGEESE